MGCCNSVDNTTAYEHDLIEKYIAEDCNFRKNNGSSINIEKQLKMQRIEIICMGCFLYKNKRLIESHDIEVLFRDKSIGDANFRPDLIYKKHGKLYHVEIDENQVQYVTMYLANINLLDIDFNCEFDLCDDETEDIINETINRIQNDLQLDLRKNKEFYTGMTLHFYPALDRLQNNRQLTDNPLKDKIQAQFQLEYKCAEIFNNIVEQHYHKRFNEHELAYIALHFGTALKK